MKIVLLGYMASGKSTVGKILAKRLNLVFFDLDAYIETREELSVSEIFKNKGEIYFRLKETEHLQNLLNSDADFVLSVGGGTPCYANNIQLISTKSQSFYLNTSINTLYSRLKNERKKRPLIASLNLENLKEFIAKHLFERNPYYNQAKYSIQTDNKEIDIIVEEILDNLI